jgi:glycosyltransferase involved in cell wall biosynthesis
MRCGVGDYTLRLAGALAALPATTVGVLTSDGADVAGPARNAIEVLPVMQTWRLSGLPALLRAIRRWRPDVVHMQYPTQGYDGRLLPSLVPLLSWLCGAHPVRTWHEVHIWKATVDFLLQALPPGRFVVVRPNFVAQLPSFLATLIRSRSVSFIPSASIMPPSALGPAERQALRAHYLGDKSRLIVFFGFLYRFKGVEQLFDIADPATDRLIIAGEAGVDVAYMDQLKVRADEDDWRGSVTFTGFLDQAEISDLLAVADAVVLPFTRGGGVWNTSAHAAVRQGTPVITTSTETQEAGEAEGISFAAPGDIKAMRAALAAVPEWQVERAPAHDDPWREIADRHLGVYERPTRAAGRDR